MNEKEYKKLEKDTLIVDAEVRSYIKYFEPIGFIDWSNLYNKQFNLEKEFHNGNNS